MATDGPESEPAGLPMDEIDWGPIFARLQDAYHGGNPEQWLDTPIPLLMAYSRNISSLRAAESVRRVNEGALVRALGNEESADAAQRILRDWEQDARAGQPEPELTEEEKAKRAKFDLLRASVMGMEI